MNNKPIWVKINGTHYNMNYFVKIVKCADIRIEIYMSHDSQLNTLNLYHETEIERDNTLEKLLALLTEERTDLID